MKQETTDQIISRLRREAMTPEQKQRAAESKRKWRERNIERVRETQRRYYETNREAIALKFKARYQATKEKSK